MAHINNNLLLQSGSFQPDSALTPTLTPTLTPGVKVELARKPTPKSRKSIVVNITGGHSVTKTVQRKDCDGQIDIPEVIRSNYIGISKD